MAKDIRCLFGKHKYVGGSMVLRYVSEDEHVVKYAVGLRCMRCGRTKEEIIEIPKRQEGRSI